jgi:hypothetical protein
MKKIARAIIVVLATLITAGLFFIPIVCDLTIIKIDYLLKCLMAWIPLNVMAFSFYFKDKEE